MEAMCEEAEALSDQQEHPLLGHLPVDAVVMPSMPVRVFMPTTVCPRNTPTAKSCTPDDYSYIVSALVVIGFETDTIVGFSASAVCHGLYAL